MKYFYKILLALILSSFLLLSACGNSDNGDNGDSDEIIYDIITPGQTFEVDGLEITFSSNIGYTIARERFSAIHNEYIFSIPTIVTNVGNWGNSLNRLAFSVYAPNNMRISVLEPWVYEETNILSAYAIRAGTTIDGNLYVLYTEDGEYIIEFIDSMEGRVEVSFSVIFDFEAVPEIQTTFRLGETLVVDGLEITVMDTVSWGTIRSSWSANDGERYFYLPVTLHNTSDQAQGFPWDFVLFGPDGNELNSITWDVEDDISWVGELLPGAETSGYLHILYTEDGVYTLQFNDWESGDQLRITVPIKQG